MARSDAGRETWRRLLEWDRGQAASERLAGHILRLEGFTGIDPSHPLGGPDGLKDVICSKNEVRWIGAAFFPRGQRTEGAIRNKLEDDLAGVARNGAKGLAFVTNQEVSLAERGALAEACAPVALELFHLERVASLLDSPACYGIRLEFLDIDMTKEEQVAFFAQITGFGEALERLMSQLTSASLAGAVPMSDLEDFERIVYSLVGSPGGWTWSSPVARLRPPLAELREYEARLTSLTGSEFIISGKIDRLRPPLRELQEYESVLSSIVGSKFAPTGSLERLRPPLEELRAYDRLLDDVLQKARALRDLERQNDPANKT
jgi:hypothetical protein